MGAEPPLPRNTDAPIVLGLQPAALIDNVAPVDCSLLDQISGERGGSVPVQMDELEYILNEIKIHNLKTPGDPYLMKTMAGGSVANTIRGLSTGFGVSSGIIGAYGDDGQGRLFVRNMSFSGVDLSRLRMKKGSTAQCVCLVDSTGNRTMRPCLSSAVKVQADDLTREDFKGSKWLLLRYGIFNLEVIQAAISIAKQEGLSVSLDLASFEVQLSEYRPKMSCIPTRFVGAHQLMFTQMNLCLLTRQNSMSIVLILLVNNMATGSVDQLSM